jgi:hypothetical protein
VVTRVQPTQALLEWLACSVGLLEKLTAVCGVSDVDGALSHVLPSMQPGQQRHRMRFYIPRIYADSKFDQYYEDKENDNIKSARRQFRAKRAADRKKIAEQVCACAQNTARLASVSIAAQLTAARLHHVQRSRELFGRCCHNATAAQAATLIPDATDSPLAFLDVWTRRRWWWWWWWWAGGHQGTQALREWRRDDHLSSVEFKQEAKGRSAYWHAVLNQLKQAETEVRQAPLKYVPGSVTPPVRALKGLHIDPTVLRNWARLLVATGQVRRRQPNEGKWVAQWVRQ